MTRYAQNTEVSSERSRAEIERTLTRYGASKFMYGWDGSGAMIAFEMNGRRIRFVLPLPDKSDFEYTDTGRPRRSDESVNSAWEQGCRQRWRALALVIKAKLEAVESGITDFQDEFLAHTVLPSGDTVGQLLKPEIEDAYLTGKMPPMLGELTGRKALSGRTNPSEET